MTFKETLLKLGEALGKSAKAVIKAIANANFLTICKFALLIGVSVAVVMLVWKFFKDKKKMYTDENNKSVVDKALEVNYNDQRNQSKLNPLMKKVKKNLKKDIKPRYKKNAKQRIKNRKEFDEYLKKIEREENERRNRPIVSKYGHDYPETPYQKRIADKLEKFFEDMEREEEIRKWEYAHPYPDNGDLRRVWDNA